MPVIDYSLHPAYRLDTCPTGTDIGWLIDAIGHKLANLASQTDLFHARIGFSSNTLVNELAQNGSVQLSLPAPRVQQIMSMAKSATQQIRESIAQKNRRKLRFRDTQIVINRDDSDVFEFKELMNCLEISLRDAGCFEIASRYFGGANVELHRTVLRINVPDQPFFTRLFNNPEIPLPPTTGMHIDANARPTINGTLYLSDVGRDHGPFSVVASSNHWNFDLFDRAVRKTIDDRLVRARVEHMFASLPVIYQRKANFGHDLLPGTQAFHTIRQLEKIHTGEAGSLILFDPEAIHKGGEVTIGERLAIIFGLRLVRQ